VASETPQPLGGGELRDKQLLLDLAHEPDPDLLALPDPPRRELRLTIALLVATSVVAVAMAAALASDARYALSNGQAPMELADLRAIAASSLESNRFVCAHGVLGAANAIRFERPFESDSYRLSPIAGRKDIWVEVRVSPRREGDRYVPPSSFCGRIVRLKESGLRHSGLASAVFRATGVPLPDDAWLLVDEEDPRHARAALALVALFVTFALWNIFAVFRLARPVRD
jgi:hypothetical protein